MFQTYWWRFCGSNICKQKLYYKASTSNLKKHAQSKHPTTKIPENTKVQVCQICSIYVEDVGKIFTFYEDLMYIRRVHGTDIEKSE